MTLVCTSGVIRFQDIDWPAIAGKTKPIDWAIAQGVPVYCRVDRKIHFAVTRMLRSVGNRPNHADCPLAGPLPEFVFTGKDTRVSFLRLDDADLESLQIANVARVREFRAGGLAARSPSECGGPHGANPSLEDFLFLSCFLVDVAHWQKVAALGSPGAWKPLHHDAAALLSLGMEDLYFEAEDVTPAVPAEPEESWPEYPLEQPGEVLPPHLLWTYRAALQFSDKTGAKPADIEAWLRKEPPKELFNNRLLRTAKNLVPQQYREAKNLDRSVFDEMPRAQELHDLRGVGFALKCALASWHWWTTDVGSRREEKREVLVRKLLDLGFGETAIGDLVQIIGRQKLSDAHLKSHLDRAGRAATFDAAMRANRLDREVITCVNGKIPQY